MSTSRTTRALLATAFATTLTASLLVSPAAHAAPLTPDTTAGVTVPDRVALKKNALGSGLKLVLDTGDTALQPASLGQFCEAPANGATGDEPLPLAGQQWMWASADWSSAVTQVVTVWADPSGALTDVIQDTGRCRYAALAGAEDVQYVDASGRVIRTTSTGVVVTALVDRSLVSIEVSGTPTDALVAQAVALSDRAVAQVDRANI